MPPRPVHCPLGSVWALGYTSASRTLACLACILLETSQMIPAVFLPAHQHQGPVPHPAPQPPPKALTLQGLDPAEQDGAERCHVVTLNKGSGTRLASEERWVGWGARWRAQGEHERGNTPLLVDTEMQLRQFFCCFFLFPLAHRLRLPTPHALLLWGPRSDSKVVCRGGLGAGGGCHRRRVCRRPGGDVSNSGDSELSAVMRLSPGELKFLGLNF